jgi:pantoate--beta-alanine ligase
MAMETVRTAAEVRALVSGWKAAGFRIAFVPTMGALHRGHLALVGHGLEIADRVIASVFVNPAQFGPREDFSKYPRQPERDAELLAGAGCAALFLPAVETIYPPGHATFVEPAGAALGLEGEFRPGHFRGVATVVAQLFHLVPADCAIFGEKDAQQLAVIRQVVRDLHFPIEIVGHPTVREEDGLALSSRNAYLSKQERRAATVLHRALAKARHLAEAGERDAETLRQAMRETVAAEPLARLDYAEVVDTESFQPVGRVAGRLALPLAARVGATRLIDNFQLQLDA